MLISVLVWIYITFLCFIWGIMAYSLLMKNSILKTHIPEFSMVCLAGLSTCGTIALMLSVFFPLDWKAHLVILLPAFSYCIIPSRRYFLPSRRYFLYQLVRNAFTFPSRVGLIAFLLLIFMVLVISTHVIIHPDTLGYHIQAILWMEKYKAIPGLAQLDLEMAFPSSWFAANAIFHIGRPGHGYALFMNGTVLCWYFLFLCKRLDLSGHSNKSTAYALFLLLFTLLSWTQVRLTAASASPDFIVSLYVLAAGYYFLQRKVNDDADYLAVLFSCTAIGIKLSAVTIAFIPLFLFLYVLSKKNFRKAITIAVLSILMVLPILVRNTIASGYIFYPSFSPDLFDLTWKTNKSELVQLQQYITVYARAPFDGYEEASALVRLPAKDWIPMWWQNLALPDQMLLSAILLLLLLNLYFFRRLVSRLESPEKILLAISLVSVFVWLIKAPNPRFGSGFLLILFMLLAHGLIKDTNFNKNNFRKVLMISAWLAVMGIAGYTFYRMVNFFVKEQIIYPEGVKEIPYKKVNCSSIEVHIPLTDSLCGGIPVPCVIDSCKRWDPIGKEIKEGFKVKNDQK